MSVRSQGLPATHQSTCLGTVVTRIPSLPGAGCVRISLSRGHIGIQQGLGFPEGLGLDANTKAVPNHASPWALVSACFLCGHPESISGPAPGAQGRPILDSLPAEDTGTVVEDASMAGGAGSRDTQADLSGHSHGHVGAKWK